jgi:hypothetical protein
VLNETALISGGRTIHALQFAAPSTWLAAWLVDRLAARAVGGSDDQPPDLGGTRADSHVRRWRNALCLSNDWRDALRATLRLVFAAQEWSAMEVAGQKRLLGHALWPQAWILLQAMSHWPRIRELVMGMTQDVQQMLAEGVMPPRLLTGDDLVQLGYKPGPKLGRLLEAVYDAQLAGDIATREEAVTWLTRHAGD